MLSVVMVTSTSTTADNNLSDYHHYHLLLFFSLNPNIPANSRSQQQISLSFANSVFSYNGQLQLQQHHSQQHPNNNSVSVVRVNSRQLERELCQCSRSTPKCITTTKLHIKQTLSSTTLAAVATAAACLPPKTLTASLTISTAAKKRKASTLWAHSCRWSRKRCCRKIDCNCSCTTSSVTCRCSLGPRFYCPSSTSTWQKALLTKAAALRLAFFSRKSILSKTQTEPIEGVIIYFKNELYFLLQIAYSAKNYLHIFISKAVLLIQKNKNNSNWTRFIQPVTSPQEQNIELIAKEFAYAYE